jgi:uncharacterized protein YkwD
VVKRTANAATAAQAVVCLINVERAERGLGSLRVSAALGESAMAHSLYMQRHGCFEHSCAGEDDLYARIRATGYFSGAGSWSYGENIAWGERARGSPRRIVAEWMTSPPHREIILHDDFEHIGVAAITGSPYSPAAGAATYTADFGSTTG